MAGGSRSRSAFYSPVVSPGYGLIILFVDLDILRPV
jgi:hypothetical protein